MKIGDKKHKSLAHEADEFMRETLRASGFRDPKNVKDDPFEKFLRRRKWLNQRWGTDLDGDGRRDY